MDMLLQENSINKDNNIINSIVNDLGSMQNTYINSTLGNIINSAIDEGLKIILPDFIENNVIDVKNAIINGGFEGGINSFISNTIDVGKKLLGINDSIFSTINEVKDSLEKGNFLGKFSEIVSNGINVAQAEGVIDKENYNSLIAEKDVIISDVNSKLDINFKSQMNTLEKIQEYCNRWDKYYNNNDLEKMEKMYNKIMDEKEKILPLEYLMNKINQIENIQNLIKNSDNNLELSSVQMALAERL